MKEDSNERDSGKIARLRFFEGKYVSKSRCYRELASLSVMNG